MKKLPDWLLNTACILTPFVSGLSIYQAVHPFLPMVPGVLLYVLAFFCLTAFCLRAPIRVIRCIQKLSAHLQTKSRAAEIVSANRAYLTAVPGFALGILYALFNAFLGLNYSSAWHGTLAAYFIVLTLLRLLLIKRFGDSPRQELRIYRACGILLSVLSITLTGAVVLLIYGTGGKRYPGFLVYAMAAYTFYKVFASICGMVKARRQESLLLIAQRNIGHAGALMSLLCLQTGLLNAFGGGDAAFAARMNGITGGFVALIVFGLGIHMMFSGRREEK